MSVRNDEKSKDFNREYFKQTYTKFEFLIIDDFSDDGSLTLLKIMLMKIIG